MSPYKSLLLIITFSYIKHNTMADGIEIIFYNYTTNLTCTSTKIQSALIGPITPIRCSVLCKESDKMCVGFGHSTDRCELCFGCNLSSSLYSINSNQITLSVDFTQELDKGVYCSRFWNVDYFVFHWHIILIVDG